MNKKNFLIKKKKIISNKDGNIYKFISSDEDEFNPKGEVYFSKLKTKKIKAWKYHLKQTQNLIVPVGSVKLILIKYSKKNKKVLQKKIISLNEKNDYKLITIMPRTWYGFKNVGKKDALIVNFTNIPHKKKEGININIDHCEFEIDWKKI
tara:strand:+ start:3817 stop:4266 length:450 start_codon:yes stop_codon:yes gene_type:complete